MEYEIKVLTESDIEIVHNFAKSNARPEGVSEMEFEMQSWSAPWREESLKHYLPNGWCFGFYDKTTDSLHGFSLAQPFCFFRGLTQTLWLEYFLGDSEEVKELILDTAYRTARSKHLQSLVIYDTTDCKEALASYKAEALQDHSVLIKTTKFK
ncbi:MAG: hypothetical protein CL677_09500 [Bdellovibrionaceae bacterium]|nr:hypothetical protein [Pseudobdellovibrionaceae bacterium]|tara:strand:+ start:361 stop:819 length:459 start_codon:yes stop_codon:yes gene_type:complete